MEIANNARKKILGCAEWRNEMYGTFLYMYMR